jgi:predicted RNase H-like nuclease (RuvC/YqgF family)
MSELIKVENDTLVRDVNTSALLETDIGKLKRYRAFKKEMKEKEMKVDMLNERINRLENIIQSMLTGN